MSYDYDDYGNPVEQDQNGPKALRDALEKAKADLKAKEQEIASLKETNATLTGQVKSTTLREAFADAGIDPKYARFAERDEVEASKEAVEKWRDENREVYAFLAAKPAEPSPEGEQPEEPAQPVADNVSPDLIAALTAAQGLESNGHPAGSTDLTDALESLDVSKIQDRAQLESLLGQLGAPLQ